MKREEEEGGEEVEEDSRTLAVWEERVVWERREPPIQYSSLEATVEAKSENKEKVAKQRESLSGKQIDQRKLTGKEGEFLRKRRRS